MFKTFTKNQRKPESRIKNSAALANPLFDVFSPISASVLTNIVMSFKIELDGFPSLCLGILFLFMLGYSWK